MSDFSKIALVGVIGFILISLLATFGIIIYKFDKLHLDRNTNIKTDLQNGNIDMTSSIKVDGEINKNVKENSGSASETTH